ncbi:HNH endonuclease family protein [Streptomyces sp. DSM 41014]|uniref:HNH endonuclease family protein n=1 Tax=Streptomyces hintoniae TaxID=3075521 RepID=A0ABU2UID6_9ACTN|nr:HNH endonuclease family protein [Streptomyces sp. DSM 41014]MDT0473021.1 HNH endonuclease family protein [Streptomyces sp. DSM 41014]
MRALVTGLAGLALLIPTAPAHAAPERAPGDTITVPVGRALADLPVQAESRDGYERTKFKHWVDADSNGCNTRAEVLLRDAVVAPTRSGRCILTGGRWVSPYDDRMIDGPSGLDIDHLVPLAEAWDSGASAWSAAERQEYANDLGDARDLVAVSAASNRSKADKDPTEWLPTAGYRCTYVTNWITDKTRWQLSVDPAEAATLRQILDDCPEGDVTVTLAR